MSYKYLGNNQYEVTLVLYQDCEHGAPMAISEDNPALLRIFKGDGSIYASDSIYSSSAAEVPLVVTGCSNPLSNCIRQAIFIKTFHLPPSNEGYHVVYQRCCRSFDITNINEPGTVGNTFYCTIPPSSLGINSSAVFNYSAPQVVCIKNQYFIDNSATDADGDSLSYEFCDTYQGGGPDNAKPLASPPPFASLSYNAQFSYSSPMGDLSYMDIDPKTGIVSGTAMISGVFLVGVACHEWRGGIKINTVRKEFELVVDGPKEKVAVPTAFTPNGDGLNDILRPIAAGGAQILAFRVYNRNGKLVCDDVNGWDGVYMKMKMDTGEYRWQTDYLTLAGKHESIRGITLLIR